MKTITRTVYGSRLNTAIIQGLPFDVVPFTTLNEKLGINKDASVHIPQGYYPRLKYLCIGNGGHEMTISNGITKVGVRQHHSTDAAPFSMIPFIMRETNNDIPPDQRAQYGLRKMEEVNGTTYISYYLKRLDFSKSKIEMWLTSVENGVKSTIPFVPNAANLNPVPQVISNQGINVIDGKYVEVTNQVEIIFTPEDCQELRHVSSVLYNDEELAIISEFGLVSGLNKQVQIVQGGSSVMMDEVIAAQLCNIFSTFRSCYIDNLGFKVLLKIGNNLPLYLTTPKNQNPGVRP